jgi:translation initiation factor IF-3
LQIEDVSVVESGPHLAKKDAYIIVRHLKYGPAKKGAKKSQDAVRMDSKAEEGDVEPLTTNSSNSVETPDTLTNSINDGNDSMSPPVVENRYKKANYRVENKFQSNAQAPPDVTENRYKQAEPRNRYQHENRFQSNAQVPPVVTENRYIQAEPGNRYQHENRFQSNAQVPPVVTDNRYIQAEPRNRYQQTTPNTSPGTRDANRWVENKVQSNAQVPPIAIENRYIKAVPRNRYQQTSPNTTPGTRDANRWTPSNLNNTRNVHVNNFNPNTESTNQAIDNPNGPQTVQRNR